MYDPRQKIKLINLLTHRILEKGVTKNRVIANEIARRWVTIRPSILKKEEVIKK